MRALIDQITDHYGKNVRLITNLMKRESPEEYPEKLKWAFQMLYNDGESWIEICRIDNYLHEGKIGSHIHYSNKLKFIDLDFREAEVEIIKIGARILRERFNEYISFGDD